MTEPKAHENLTLRRIYDAPPERVFRAWTDPAELARWNVPADGWTIEVLEVDLHVPADEQVQAPVAVVVGEAAPGRPAAARQARPRRDVGERAVVVVVIEVVPTESGDVEVLPAVPVHVGGAGTHPPARVRDAGPVGDVLEPAVPEVAVERAARGLRVLRGLDGQRVHQVDVDPPVVVVVEEGHAAGHRLDDVLLVGGGVVLERHAGLGADVAEEKPGRIAARDLSESDRGDERESERDRSGQEPPPRRLSFSFWNTSNCSRAASERPSFWYAWPSW